MLVRPGLDQSLTPIRSDAKAKTARKDGQLIRRGDRMNRYFVMLFNQLGDSARPIMDDDEVVFWPTKAEADAAMHDHPLAKAFGYEVHGIY